MQCKSGRMESCVSLILAGNLSLEEVNKNETFSKPKPNVRSRTVCVLDRRHIHKYVSKRLIGTQTLYRYDIFKKYYIRQVSKYKDNLKKNLQNMSKLVQSNYLFDINNQINTT